MSMTEYHILFGNRLSESWQSLSREEFLGFLRPKVETALTWEELEEKLGENRVLNIKLGIDPTGAELHLGHLVPVLLLNQFLRAGHHIDFVIGDFTARIGDPSGRDSQRTPLTTEDIEKNFKTYTEQVAPYLDISKVSVRKNREWLSKMTLEELFPLLQGVNLREATQREDFRARLKNQEGVSLAEATYGVLMGIDSVELKTDVELGGIDQLLNFQQCRSVLLACGLPREVALTTPILLGTAGDGRKMSKSFGNYIPLSASLEDKFGKIMSIPDSLLLPYFLSFADVHEKEVSDLKDFIAKNPLEAKKQLGTFLVFLETRDMEKALQERDKFERKFSRGDLNPEDVVSISAKGDESIFDILTQHIGESKSELRRLFAQGAVSSLFSNGEKEAISPDVKANELQSDLVKVGKYNLFKINIE